MSIPLSKLPAGVLNERVREKVYEGIDLTRDNFFDVFRSMVSAQFGEQYSIINSEFTGVCIQILTEEEKQRLVTAGAFAKIASTSSMKLKGKTVCRVFIPEIHHDRALPDDIYLPTDKDKVKMEAFFPLFVSDSDEIASKTLQIGHLVKVKIKNHNGAGVYFDIIGGVNSSINIYNESPPSAKSFKCDLFRFSKIVNSQGRSISFGQVLTDEKPQSNNKLNEASLKQQYKKYLAEKEMFFYKTLKDYWSPSKFIGLINLVVDSGIYGENNTTNVKKLFYLLLQKLSTFSPTGITNAGLTVLNVDSIDDSYGIFKHTKKQFDTYQLNFDNDTIIPTDLNVNNEVYKSAQTAFFVENEEDSQDGGFQHSDLLDPYVSMYFFLLDLIVYLDDNDRDLLKVADDLFEGSADNASAKKLITNYFTKNDKKIDFLFTEDYQIIANQYTELSNFAQSIGDKPSVKPPQFFSFESWLTEAGGGAAVDIGDFIKESTPAPDNSQVLDEEEPQDTKDECHDNYPQRNSYLEHVDTQKKIFREYLDSPISGEELSYLSNTHVGVKNILFSDIKISTPFKVVRFDGDSGFQLDSKRWFNKSNTKNLKYNKNYNSGYYRPRDSIFKVTIGSLDLKSDSENFHKTSLDLMYNLNKPVPHFLIQPNGQIIQLVDVTAVIKNNLNNASTSVNISFTDGIGTAEPFVGQNNSALNNYILVNTDPKASIYRPHKIGTKAALQSAHELIKFLISQTRIKYNLAAQDFHLLTDNINNSGIQAYGHYKGVSGMNFIYYAWTLGLAYRNGGKNIPSIEYGYN